MSFEDDFDMKDEIFGDIQKVQRVAALSILNDVIVGTPKDTGEAQGGWQVATGEPTRKERSRSRRAAGALTEGNRIIKQATPLGTKTKKRGVKVELQDLFITNLKPYIVRLENGWSDQNSHFVAAAVQKAEIGEVKLG
tara:strand:+ start:5741 stop:6154 length:414 start_codon:yes stop_codon:yes gene_type:complete